jgi:hypothetical protein
MKIKYLLSIVALSVLMLGVACKTVNTVTGVKEFDPAKTAQVKAVVKPPIKQGVRILLAKNVNHRAEILKYLASGRDIFCNMQKNKNFSPAYLIEQANLLGTPELAKALNDDYILTAKDLIIALYTINFADKGNVAIPEETWGYQISEVFCESLTEAINES